MDEDASGVVALASGVSGDVIAGMAGCERTVSVLEDDEDEEEGVEVDDDVRRACMDDCCCGERGERGESDVTERELLGDAGELAPLSTREGARGDADGGLGAGEACR